MKQSPKMPAEKRRAQLIRAAEKVFSRKGYSGATTEEIARAARLTKGALYFHFKNKEDIFFEVMKEINANQTQKITQFLEEETNPETAIEKAIRSAFELIEKQKYFTVEFWQQAHKIPRVRNYLSDEHRKLRNKVVRFFQKNSNLKKKECETFFTLLHAIFDGIMVRDICYSHKDDLSGLAGQVVEVAKLYLRKDKLKLD